MKINMKVLQNKPVQDFQYVTVEENKPSNLQGAHLV